ncbi:hypothetical protein [Blastococcus brunescens]|uniref:Major facilitator superfamily (MFS) profile domain-containing protein n=1 Tax=Blastococcus brunescens TaxID=1564165 RepID=A0ABZ1AVH6_9ACTN|nr:hypothetical protein [Blastococcus sp. BMG 8361]WRL61941.1 hypothetical protein U6N30_17775 [Blastococcus sp. BMG 8361]
MLVTAVVLVTLAFGLGQPALMAAVGGAVPADVRGVALGIATLVFLVGGVWAPPSSVGWARCWASIGAW